SKRDWSSDVCSSDLPRDTDAPPLSLLSTIESVAGCSVRRIAVDEVEDVDAVLAVSYGQAGPTDTELMYFERAATATRPGAALIEIGRASWRERWGIG